MTYGVWSIPWRRPELSAAAVCTGTTYERRRLRRGCRWRRDSCVCASRSRHLVLSRRRPLTSRYCAADRTVVGSLSAAWSVTAVCVVCQRCSSSHCHYTTQSVTLRYQKPPERPTERLVLHDKCTQSWCALRNGRFAPPAGPNSLCVVSSRFLMIVSLQCSACLPVAAVAPAI